MGSWSGESVEGASVTFELQPEKDRGFSGKPSLPWVEARFDATPIQKLKMNPAIPPTREP